MALISLVALLAHLTVYLTIAKPINKLMTEGVKFGRLIANIRELQQRWDSMIWLRAALLFIAMAALIIVNYC
ncbi:hypothetical protein [Mucilaginibacter sp. PPCGB 2223]|uniref:hypothetical protein n=1 Tax=Mucilaginibacter sp. PPCGB 2223 TaxID=1886027 RepID=UPI0009F6922C|nr:hypothetical protein [Mucilaginibacter sp. PPCGB 2223]